MNNKNKKSIVSADRLEKLAREANKELKAITPEIEYLEECVKKLSELKEKKRKLNSLIINLKSIVPLNDVKINKENTDVTSDKLTAHKLRNNNVNTISIDTRGERKVFIPEVALSNVKRYLRSKNNINYEIYKAVVYNTGEASTEEIKHYLVKNNIKQPKSGKGFEDVPLKEISSRANYLVRKQLLISYSSGLFSTVFGWEEIE